MITRGGIAIIVALAWVSTPTVHATPGVGPTIECPHSHAHVWNRDQCDNIGTQGPFGFPGHGGGGQCGGLCGLIRGIGGLLG